MTLRQKPPQGVVSAQQGDVPLPVRAISVLLAAWCVGFAAVNAWQLVTDGLPDTRHPGYATALTVMSAIVLAVKLLGGGVALASTRSIASPRRRWLLGAALWGATSLLAVYSAGSLVLVLGNATGLLEPSDAWVAAGGVSLRATAYVLFFLLGTAMFFVLAVAFQSRHSLQRSAGAAGVVGGPVLLLGLLFLVPAVLRTVGLMPAG